MTTDDIIKFYGGRDNALIKLDIYRQLWESWVKNGIPKGRQAQIQIQTLGKLRADKGEVKKC